ncbi:hypothetical protein ACFV1W_16035 [Kitasatospora sp. NPDC059648]|uniref:hypothetical protein n=1 Tax=Kitasatospora sp. NPDC059648 TaxID=3346894 RepID=UPI0036A617A2
MENQWGAISRFINARANPSGQSVNVMGHNVTTIAAVLYCIGFIEANGGILHSRS